MGRLVSAISDFANEAFKKPETAHTSNMQFADNNNNGQYSQNMGSMQYPSSINNTQSYPNYSNNGQYPSNMNSVSSYPNNNTNGQYPNNPPQYQNNANNAQHALNSNNGQFQTMPNNQQNSYNMDPNDQQATQDQNEGKKTGARTGFIEFGLPIVLRYALEDSLGLVWASVISSIPIILSMLYSTFVKRMFSPFPLIMILSIYMDMGFQLAFKNERLQLLSGTVVSGIVALVIFVSIPFDNKFVYYLAKPLATGGDHEKGLEFDAKWRMPMAKVISTRISIGVGIGFIIAAGVNAAVVFALPLGMINIASTVVSIGAAVVIGAWAGWYKTRKTNQLMAAAQAQQDAANLAK
ncbi:hypothetical protein CONCODRAFT_67170 [Conidiobolus coronatus NRRL 28638]|uniref:Uncharacterized protein n=1 Tax=Conidiobolus coronatus (strain ATCC 28846 / CBS 209.66 / NRRL 28638) TaxID=796925 RepID=A0A137PIU5_CONC2|nr:hypothetical protein CONCODRAFT_67170 [Conidiobolus coronatus NRRL 28638]|eukprot:KXN74917.1 hypothetical protein CONCODRAFT_67170 [Conidiobolus coronatus NRRL 28638]